ncbi:MAG: LPS export ABC transporter periplasmic protein LptC [Candidatus Latescibacteria bacterium]|nr:LPS export ABC transporter periplasmic protein LptC [Candidatus Latescibacterota bacterium]MBT4140702.1 LPS export ABC transporter periplasmic protein LptC [Candidatus Latescibacterota bacterium]MBT5832503.1 LPS export ABC transporter periplasmic protein LptC [Candidatus Latescibacterota bacterium]
MPILELRNTCLKNRLLIKFVGLLVCIGGCYSVEQPKVQQKTRKAPDLVMRGWQTVVMRAGRSRVKVSADSLSRVQAQGQAHFKGHVRVVFFDSRGDTASVLSATRGVVDSRSRHITVAGQVVVLAHDSTRLETDSLRWDREDERIYGDGLVSIFRPEGREQGVGFDASADLKQWTLKHVQTHVIGKVK